MDWLDAGRKAIQTGLPTIGGLIGGPLGATAGKLVGNLVGAIFGEDEEVTPENFSSLLDNPDLVIRLKEIETTHASKLQELSIEAERIRLADVASARTRQVESERATGKRDINLYALAWLIVIGFFGLMGLLLWRPIPESNSQAGFMMFGSLIAGFGSVIQYFFGSSKSSSDKTKLLMEKKS